MALRTITLSVKSRNRETTLPPEEMDALAQLLLDTFTVTGGTDRTAVYDDFWTAYANESEARKMAGVLRRQLLPIVTRVSGQQVGIRATTERVGDAYYPALKPVPYVEPVKRTRRTKAEMAEARAAEAATQKQARKR